MDGGAAGKWLLWAVFAKKGCDCSPQTAFEFVPRLQFFKGFPLRGEHHPTPGCSGLRRFIVKGAADPRSGLK